MTMQANEVVMGAAVDATSARGGPEATDADARRADTRSALSHRRLVRRSLVAADAAGLAVAFATALVVAGADVDDFLPILLALPAALGAIAGYGLYDQNRTRTGHSTVDELWALMTAVTVAAFATQAAVWATGLSLPTYGVVFAFWATACVAVPVARASARFAVQQHRLYRQRAVIVGAGDVGQLVARKIAQHPEYGIEVVGFVDDRPRQRPHDLDQAEILGAPQELQQIVHTHGIGRVIFAFSNDGHERTLDLVRSIEGTSVRVDVVPRLFEVLGPGVAFDGVEAVPLVSLRGTTRGSFGLAVKRAIDLVGAAALLMLTAPLFAYAAWRIPRESAGPVFFRQVRLGKDMKEIKVLKFRTMRTDVDLDAHRTYIESTMRSSDAGPESNGLYKLDQERAVTPFGRWLRRTSLDELPQLINVLRGEMSLVGPRPCLAYETQTFQRHHFVRFQVAPGMTGLWQVSARARATFREALEMDALYALNWSLRLDLALLIRTPLQLVRLKATV